MYVPEVETGHEFLDAALQVHRWAADARILLAELDEIADIITLQGEGGEVDVVHRESWGGALQIERQIPGTKNVL